MQVLLVEDSASDARLIQIALSEVRGYSMETAVVGRLDEALAALAARPFDVALVDLSLPDSSGSASFLRIKEKFPRLPIVVLTGANDDTAGVEAIRQGVQDFLVKGESNGATIARSIRYAVERKLAEVALQEKNDALAIANSELESFSYSVAHDLRNPLNAIIACGAVLCDDEGRFRMDDMRKAAEHINIAARRMSQIITDLLELSRITRQEVVRERINLSDMARSIFRQLEAGEANRKVAIDIAADLIADADAGLSVILLENLLRNAWKYTARNEQARIEVGRPNNADRTVFSVRDNGVGFDMSKAERLFKPFHRLHSSREFEGTGIGLAIAKNIVDKHGGRIWAEAAPDKGASFFFRLE